MKTLLGMLRRLWPRRLLGQTVLLVVIALVAAQVVGALIVRGDATSLFKGAEERFIANRLAPVAALLGDTPAPLQERTVAAFSSPRFRVWLGTRPAVPAAGADPDSDDPGQDLRDRLAEEIGANLIGPPRVRIRDDDRDDDWHALVQGVANGRMGAGMPGRMAPPPPPPHDLVRLKTLIALPLGPDRWLNAAVSEFRERPLLRPEGWISVIVAALIVSIIVALTLRRITRPLTRLSDAAERLGRGEDVEPLPEDGPADIRDATRAFNAMQGRLHRFVSERTQMLAAVSHDLRTPITSLRLRAEMLDDDEARERMIATLDDMQRMTEATLAFARGEASGEPTRITDLDALLQAITDDLSDLGMDVALTAERTDYPCRATALGRALRNLIENAAKYGDRARVSLTAGKNGIEIVIDDDGPGIPESEQARVFEPFVRLEKSRSTETGGIGLGMAIARDIVHRHGGDIRLENRPEGGLRVTVTLPPAA